jgi:cytosine/uracil/thiamine/allantoin permease
MILLKLEPLSPDVMALISHAFWIILFALLIWRLYRAGVRVLIATPSDDSPQSHRKRHRALAVILLILLLVACLAFMTGMEIGDILGEL